MVLNVVLVDDEDLALKNLEAILHDFCLNVKIVGKTTSPFEAIELIKKLKPHLVFSDINMPEMDGFQMLDKLTGQNFEIIFVTAFNDYAIKAFKISAIDYILKPINIPEVIQAVNRVEKIYEQEEQNFGKYKNLLNNLESKSKSNEKILLSTSNGVELVLLEDIVYIEAIAGYTVFYLKDKTKIMVSKTIGEVELMIKSDNFIRIHKATVINISFLKRYSLSKTGGEVELQNGVSKSISRRKRQEFIEKVKTFEKKY